MDITVDQVYTIKLVSSEELVAKVTNKTPTTISVQHPLAVVPQQGGFGLINALFTADPKGEIQLNMSAISVIAETEESVKNKYLGAISKIIMPEQKKILVG